MHPTPAATVPVPRVDVPAPRVVAAIPNISAAVPRVPTTTTIAQREAPASQLAKSDDDTQHDLRQHSYNTRAKRSLEHVVAANNLSVEIAMMAEGMEVPQIEPAMMATETAVPQIDSKPRAGISWSYDISHRRRWQNIGI